MSLDSRDDENDSGEAVVGQRRGRRNADVHKERFSKHIIEARLREAEFKDSMSMELTPYDEFLLQHKQFFKKIIKKGD